MQSNVFDIVYSQAVGEHVQNLKLFFSESIRVLSANGIAAHISAPLFYSRYGHHKENLFRDFPWIHVGRNDEAIIKHLYDRGVSSVEIERLRPHIYYMMNKSFINQETSQSFLDAVNSLSDVEILFNEFDLEELEIDNIPEEVMSRIPSGVSGYDLIRTAHIFKCRKL